MIRVEAAPEPATFDAQVRQPGNRALLELVGDPGAPGRTGPRRTVVAARIEDIPAEKLPDLWRGALPGLMVAYRGVCAYAGMRIHPVTGGPTVDHFQPKRRHPRLAYEWSNFRLACRPMNTHKADHEDVLDPFAVQNGWFVLNVGTFEVRAAAGLAVELRSQIEATIARLKLNDPVVCAARREYHDRYHGLSAEGAAPLSFAWLQQECPFVAAELQRQGRLRPDAEVPGDG